MIELAKLYLIAIKDHVHDLVVRAGTWGTWLYPQTLFEGTACGLAVNDEGPSSICLVHQSIHKIHELSQGLVPVWLVVGEETPMPIHREMLWGATHETVSPYAPGYMLQRSFSV